MESDYKDFAMSFWPTASQGHKVTRAEFLKLAQWAVQEQNSARSIEESQWIAELASGATASAGQLRENDDLLEAIHLCLLALEDEYNTDEAERLRSEISRLAALGLRGT